MSYLYTRSPQPREERWSKWPDILLSILPNGCLTLFTQWFGHPWSFWAMELILAKLDEGNSYPLVVAIVY